MRICGAGIGITTLFVTNGSPALVLTSAIGCNYADPAHFLDGFEVSDLSVNANASMATSTGSTGGIAITGRHVDVRRVQVVAFGLIYAVSIPPIPNAYGISVARSYGAQSSPPEDCIIDSCRAEIPGPTTSPANAPSVIAFHIGAETDGAFPTQLFHKYCVIRNCYADFGAVTLANLQLNYIGIMAGGGIGTIVEGNRVLSCGVGVTPGTGGLTETKDLILRNNFCYNVISLFTYQGLTSDPGFRLLMLGNAIDWPTATIMLTNSITAISIAGQTGKLVLRENVIRRLDDAPNGYETGIDIANAVNAIVENNVINISTPDKGFAHSSCSFLKVFNNRTTSGTLLAGWNRDISRHDPELTTDAEDSLLGLFAGMREF